ncbi:MAG: hypothetical protein AAFY34_00385 [Pseudomonadota bacterium]
MRKHIPFSGGLTAKLAVLALLLTGPVATAQDKTNNTAPVYQVLDQQSRDRIRENQAKAGEGDISQPYVIYDTKLNGQADTRIITETAQPNGGPATLTKPNRLRLPGGQLPDAFLGGGAPIDQSINRGLTPVITTRPDLDSDVYKRSVAGMDAVWQTPVIPVCWENMDPEHADGLTWTEDAVRQTWEKVSNLTFTGWETCEDNSAGIRIKVADEVPRVEDLGRALDGLPDGMVLNFTFESWGADCQDFREFCIRALAVHEFGHAIGLTHEHNRDDAREVCDADIQGPLPAFFMTRYDPTSIMNYCSPEWNNQGQLSALDVAGVRMLYGPFSDETPATVVLDGSMMIGDGPSVQFFAIDQPPVVFALTEEMPVNTWQLSVCDNNDRVVRIDYGASVQPDSHLIDVTYTTTLLSADSCVPRAELLSETQTDTLSDPVFFSPFRQFDLPAGASGDAITVYASMRRTVGDEQIVESCEGCSAAASEAIFANPPHTGHSHAEPEPAKSPWPDELDADFKACETAALAGPGFEGGDWPEAEIKRLCTRTPTSKEPAACYASVVGDGLEWGGGTVWVPQNIVSLCEGTLDAKTRIGCFVDQRESGLTWQAAIETCKST